MAIRFGMPSLGHTMESGKVVEWLKQEGDTLRKGDPLLLIETDKVVTEVESPADGVLTKIVVPVDKERPIGSTLALLSRPGEILTETQIRQLVTDDAVVSVKETATTPKPAIPSTTAGRVRKRVRISPVARKLARQRGIDPATVTGTGPGGRITKNDVLNAAQRVQDTTAVPTSPHPPRGVAATVPLTGIRGRVAARMSQSWNTIPQVTEVIQVDMSSSVAYRKTRLQQWQDRYGLRISLNDLITKAVAVALARHPRLNATLVDQVVRVHDRIHIGMAVSLEEGLLVPVIRDAHTKPLGQIAQESRDLAEKARSGRLQLRDLSDSTFTITNLGTVGVELFTPIINPPQVAILGVGRIQPRPLVVEGKLEIHESAYLCLVFDHRALDGAPAARFLQELQHLLANPHEYAEQ